MDVKRPAGQPEANDSELHPGDEAPAGTPQTAENLCRHCAGSGRDRDRLCTVCGGSGYVIVIVGDA